jgi:hypothetical protein
MGRYRPRGLEAAIPNKYLVLLGLFAEFDEQKNQFPDLHHFSVLRK